MVINPDPAGFWVCLFITKTKMGTSGLCWWPSKVMTLDFLILLGWQIVLLNICYLEDWVQDKRNKCTGELAAIRSSTTLEKLSVLCIVVPSVMWYSISEMQPKKCSIMGAMYLLRLTYHPRVSSSCLPPSGNVQLVSSYQLPWQASLMYTSQQTASVWMPSHGVQIQSQLYHKQAQPSSIENITTMSLG